MGDRARTVRSQGPTEGGGHRQIPTLCRTVGDGPGSRVVRFGVCEGQWRKGAPAPVPRPEPPALRLTRLYHALTFLTLGSCF